MNNHPFTETKLRKAFFGLSIILSAGALFALLMLYCNLTMQTALADSLTYMGVLSTTGYLYWYVAGFMKSASQQAVLLTAVQTISLAAALFVLYLLNLDDNFTGSVPLHLALGIPCWVIILLLYRIRLNENAALEEPEYGLKKTIEELSAAKSAKSLSSTEKTPETAAEQGEDLNRISVKDGSKIHILKIEELNYIQAYGDYVFLFTDTNKYIKELTMKYLEINLPDNFIRIHRSYIINTDKINRIELFGKEIYSVKLKNDVTLRISSSGYKLLKYKLML